MSPTEESASGNRADTKYRTLLELGEGGTANVYLAVALGIAGFNKLVVLKVLKRQLGGMPEMRADFLREARLSARLNHPNVVSVTEVTEQGGLPVMVMEYLQGQPLSTITSAAGDKLTLAHHLRILSDALAGLHYSHELCDYDGTPLNLVHRDVTPHNVFVTFDGAVKVLDFGIAKLSSRQGRTETGVIKGKLRYMPPEQIAGTELDRRADVFAVGVMLWEATTGERLWQDLSEATVMMNVINGQIPTARSVKPDCPAELDRICAKAMAFDREGRYPTVAELQQDLDNFIASHTANISNAELGRSLAAWFSDLREETKRTIEEKLAGAGSFSWTGIDQVSLAPSLSSERKVKARRSKALLVAGIVLAGAVAVGAAFALRKGPAPKPASGAVASSERATVSVRITVFPDTARLTVDGRPVLQNPYVEEAPADRSWHTLRAEAPGYLPEERRYERIRDIEMVVSLRQQPAPATAPTAAGGEPPRTRPKVKRPLVKPNPLPAGADCSPPYAFDEHGVKRFKPQCLK